MEYIRFLIPVLMLSACGNGESPKSVARSGGIVVSGEAAIGGDYTLINQDGETVTQDTFLGRPQLIYFGFTFCPDVCPTSLQQLAYALDEVDPDADYFQPVFISVDPERDTPGVLGAYVRTSVFPDNLKGLTGTVEQVEQAKTAYKMYSAKVNDPDSTAGYTIDHLSLVYLMDKNGKFADVFSHTTTTEEMIDRLRAYKISNP
ncbi:MAG: SCO family protein [Hyphomonadaceae bacterium]|nr:SCO family protein [Hyphomonadaceae bacterium]